MEERLLTEKLIGYDSSTPEGIRMCAGFVKGWLEARDIRATQLEIRELPILIAGSLYLAGEVLRLNDEIPD